jgi:transglutaminase-like putative cysteine protease
MLGASMIAAFAVARLTSGSSWPAIVSAAVGSAVVVLLCRRGVAAIVGGVAAVAVSSLLWGAHAATRRGVISLQGFSAARRSLQAAHAQLSGFHFPLVVTPGIVVLCALTAGLAAVGGRALGIRYPALSLVPAAALLSASAILLPAIGAAVAGLVLGGFGFLVLAGDRGFVRRASLAVAVVSLGTASLTVVWATTGSGSGAALPGGRTAPAVAPSALSLASDLTGIETRDANVVLFETRSPISTYWQVTSLTEFVDDQWVPDSATEAIMRGQIPSVATSHSVGRLFTALIKLSAYSGRLLPVPPSTIEAAGAGSPVVTPAGVVAASTLEPGNQFEATAQVPVAVADSPAGRPAPGAETAVGSIPSSIRSLALSITSGQTTPLEKAEALTDFFRSGRFHYTVSDVAPAAGDPLVSFLTRTHTGSCEQFASAFAVMARVSGLAARVAIGFTPGRPSNGVNIVRGSDAHAWPQVLVDGNWVSFEPTPQLPSGELSPPGVLGPSGLGHPNPTGHGSLPPVSLPKIPIVAPTAPATTVPVPLPSNHAGGGIAWVIVALIVAALVGGTGVLLFFCRRTRLDQVVRSWQAIDRALARRGWPRPASSTPSGHTHHLSQYQIGEQAIATIEDMTTVATILQDVTYGSVELTPEHADRAARASRRARRAILAGALSSPVAPRREIIEAAPG